jgi:hypothetical protein
MWPYDFAENDHWQMALGERAALEGVLAWLRPRLAVELGTAEGGSLQAIAAHSEEVHTFDLEPRPREPVENVILHRGDSHVLLPQLLAAFTSEHRNVDFVLVDADKSTKGVRQDILDLLVSDAIRRTVVLLHDSMNEAVRAGMDSIDFGVYPKVRYVDSQFVLLAQRPRPLQEIWGGLGIIMVEADSSSERQILKRRLPYSPYGSRGMAWRLGAPGRRMLRRMRPLARRLRGLRATHGR